MFIFRSRPRFYDSIRSAVNWIKIRFMISRKLLKRKRNERKILQNIYLFPRETRVSGSGFRIFARVLFTIKLKSTDSRQKREVSSAATWRRRIVKDKPIFSIFNLYAAVRLIDAQRECNSHRICIWQYSRLRIFRYIPSVRRGSAPMNKAIESGRYPSPVFGNDD